MSGLSSSLGWSLWSKKLHFLRNSLDIYTKLYNGSHRLVMFIYFNIYCSLLNVINWFEALIVRAVFFLASLNFMIGTQVTVLANAFSIQDPIMMRTLSGFLCSAFSMVTILTHAISVVWLSLVSAFWNIFPMFLNWFGLGSYLKI
jgi:hypothetical protein